MNIQSSLYPTYSLKPLQLSTQQNPIKPVSQGDSVSFSKHNDAKNSGLIAPVLSSTPQNRTGIRAVFDISSMNYQRLCQSEAVKKLFEVGRGIDFPNSDALILHLKQHPEDTLRALSAHLNHKLTNRLTPRQKEVLKPLPASELDRPDYSNLTEKEASQWRKFLENRCIHRVFEPDEKPLIQLAPFHSNNPSKIALLNTHPMFDYVFTEPYLDQHKMKEQLLQTIEDDMNLMLPWALGSLGIKKMTIKPTTLYGRAFATEVERFIKLADGLLGTPNASVL